MRKFEDLKKNIENLLVLKTEELIIMTNLGPNIYAHAKALYPQYILINIGLGFYLECSWKEALNLIEHKLKITETQVDLCTTSIAKMKSNIHEIKEIISD